MPRSVSSIRQWKRDAVNIKAVGIPNAMVVKLPYYFEDQEEVILGDSNNLWTFRLNSIRDPDQTGGGTFPYGYTSYSRLYDEYMVLTATSVLEVIGIDGGYGKAFTFFSDTPGFPSGFGPSNLINNKGVKYKTFNSPAAGNRNIVKFKQKWRLSDWLGRDYDPSRDSAAFNADPTQGAYMNVCVTNDSSNDSATFTVRLRIVYQVRLFTYKEQSAA